MRSRAAIAVAALVACMVMAGQVAHGLEGQLRKRIEDLCKREPREERKVMLVFPLVAADSTEHEVGWGRGLIAMQAMWKSSFCHPRRRLLDTWDGYNHKLFFDQQLIGPGRQVTPEKIEKVCAAADTENYTTGALEVSDEQYVAGLTFHGARGTEEHQYTGPKEELHILPCLIAADVVRYMYGRIWAQPEELVMKPCVGSTEDFDAVAERYTDLVPMTNYCPFWKEVMDRLTTSWTAYHYALSMLAEKPYELVENWKDYLGGMDQLPVRMLEREFLCRCSSRRQSLRFRALLQTSFLVRDDPYNAPAIKHLALAVAESGDDEAAEKVAGLIKKSFGDSFLANYHYGDFLVSFAWVARGGGWGYTVTESGGQLFRERLVRARRELETALSKEPGCWDAASRLIAVGMGAGMPYAYKRQAFDMAVRTCPTAEDPYYNLSFALLPRWGGSRQTIIEFGRECVATGHWKTRIPLVLTQRLMSTLQDAGLAERREYFTQAEVWNELRPVLTRLAEENPYSQSVRDHGLLQAYWNGDRELAQRLYRRTRYETDEGEVACFDTSVISKETYQEIGNWLGGEWPPLHEAIMYGRSEETLELIAGGADVNEAGADGWTPLHLAAKYGRIEVCRELIAGGADLNAVHGEGEAPLVAAVRRENEDVARLFVEAGADPDAKDKEDMAVLHKAVRTDQAGIVQLLLSHGADTEIRNEYNKTPLHYAAAYNRPHLARMLLDHGADVQAEYDYKRTVLWRAVRYNNTAVMPLLLEAGARLDHRDKWDMQPLHCAAMDDAVDAGRLLLEAGANVNAVGGAGDKIRGTALDWAARNADMAFVRLLMQHGADPMIPGAHGRLPLHRACEEGRTDMAVFLIEKGVDINVTDDNGWTPLAYAARAGQVHVAETLVAKGAALDCTDQEGNTLLHHAALSKEGPMACWLLERGLDVNATNHAGETPILLAVEANHPDVVEALLKAGAGTQTAAREKTLLQIAEENGSDRAVELLREVAAGQ